jgi:predicted DNA-binding transcriptional regulator AlpA
MTTDQLADLFEEFAQRLRGMGPIEVSQKAPVKKHLKTEKEMMATLGISRKLIQNLRTSRLIPYVKLGRSVRYNPEEVSKAIEKLTINEIGRGKNRR